MEFIHGLLVITFIHILAVASPGPDFFLVSQQTLSNGKKAGLMCSIGITLGLTVHLTYSAFGLAAIIANSSNALWVIKILGGGYLIYLGIKGLQSKASPSEAAQVKKAVPASVKKSIGMGFLCNVLNPKVPIYFMSLFTLVLKPDMPLHHIAFYGLWMMLIQLSWFSFIVLLLSHPKINKRFKQSGHIIDRVLGGAMILLGLKLLLTRSTQ
ncbi:LysE family translocator [Marinagarivorans algicola]|uniref:LysE family translocator n=1 Tax=Marinagarivorans algicola TaxID=1513270 RepID=UPI0006B8E986|nr:LysE family transporter [Marinagarivorans algicola]